MQNDLADRQIEQAEGKLSLLLKEVQGTPIFDRAKLYVSKFSGGRPFSEWVHDDKVAVKDRLTVAKALVEILLTKAHGRLPEIASPTNFSSVAVGSATTDAAKACAPVDRAGNRNQGHSGETETTLADPPDLPPPDELRKLIRIEVRAELASMLELIARALRESK